MIKPYNQIPNAIREATSKYFRNTPSYRWVFDTESIVTVDKIYFILLLSYHYNSSNEVESTLVTIAHDDFRKFCEDTSRLAEEVDTDTYEDISYLDYVNGHANKHDFKEYITSKNLVPASYEFAF